MSEETTAFTTEIFADGVHIGYAKNSGHGGCTDCHPCEGKKELFRKAEAHCLTLPSKKYSAEHGMKAFEVKMDLEQFVERLMYDELEKKEKVKQDKKFAKKFETAIIFEHGDKVWTVNLKRPLSSIPTTELQRLVDLYKNQVKAIDTKATLMNNNLEKLGIKL